MKKVMGLLVFVLGLCLITGCGKSKNTITCTQEANGEKAVITATTDKDDKIVKVKMETTQKFDSKEEMESQVKMIEVGVNALKAMDGIDASLKKNGTKATLILSVNLEKADTSMLSSFGLSDLIDTKATGSEFKKNAEKDGATCK